MLRIARASARMITEEMAARWCGKKDRGEAARLRPYGVESWPWASCVWVEAECGERGGGGTRSGGGGG